MIKMSEQRFELNFNEDKVNDVEAIGDDCVLDLKDCCRVMNEQQATIEAKDKDIKRLERLLSCCKIDVEYLHKVVDDE